MAANDELDLSRLSSRIRNTQSRRYFQQAVACYRVGCLSQSVVTAWTSVVHDLLCKCREIALLGDDEFHDALKQIENYDKLGRMSVIEAVNFEAKLLEAAGSALELVTSPEQELLQRLLHDRDRCLHPEMQSLDEPYEPSVHQAREHLHNLVLLVLQREPVQGRAAVERIWANIHSDYFPDDTDAAARYLRATRLPYARSSLVHDMLSRLIREALIESRSEVEQRRLFAAFGAILQMFSDTGEALLQRLLPTLIDHIPEDNCGQVIAFFAAVPQMWDTAGEAMQSRIRHWVEQRPADLLLPALGVKGLRSTAEQQIQKLRPYDLLQLIRAGEAEACTARCVELFCTSRRIVDTEAYGRALLVPVARFVTAEQAGQVADAIATNDQIYYSWKALNEAVPAFFERAEEPIKQAKDAWKQAYQSLQERDLGDNSASLCKLIAERFPEVVSPASHPLHNARLLPDDSSGSYFGSDPVSNET